MKIRLDVYLADNAYFESRERAKRAIMEGLVYVDGNISDKPGTMIKDDAKVFVKGDVCPYVSRGGYKLEKALASFHINPKGFRCIDIGSSTGGFTDCLLQNGAVSVCCVDVGTNQLAYKLRSDPRVDVKEQYNFRFAEEKDFNGPYDFACTDVSFISLKHIFPGAFQLLKENAHMVCLIKPQFEAGRDQVGKNGIIKDKNIHIEVISKVISYSLDNAFDVCALDYSPIKGAKGNIEYLLLIQKNTQSVCRSQISSALITETVEKAHMEA